MMIRTTKKIFTLTGILGLFFLVTFSVIDQQPYVHNTLVYESLLYTKERPWYMTNGTLQPTPCCPSQQPCEADKCDATNSKQLCKQGCIKSESLLPEDSQVIKDRIVNQLMYKPPEDQLPDQNSSDSPLKKILLWNGGNSWAAGGVKAGRGLFLKEQCPISTCALLTSRREHSKADLVIFKDHFMKPSFDRPPNQLWMIYMLESPLHSQHFRLPNVFNWTATYRSDSTIATPYGKWQYYDENIKTKPQTINYAANKTRQVAWFVSNCQAKNDRLQYAKELGKYINVDIYGTCGDKKCPRSQPECQQMLDTKYKFYLSFENSNCAEYITEKLYENGLQHNILPIVMGARPSDYAQNAPHKSYIHVDDFSSAQELAAYLHKLDQNDDLYNEYFQWKGTGEMINTKFFCRLCAVLHSEQANFSERHYDDINKWWREKACVKGTWRRVLGLLSS